MRTNKKNKTSKPQSSPIDGRSFFSNESSGQHSSGPQATSNHNPSKIQRKLFIGQANDKYEVEADRVADEVVSISNNKNLSYNNTGQRIQRKCASCKEDDKYIQKKSLASNITPLIQTSVSNPSRSTEASEAINSKIINSKGGGNLMNKDIRTSMENSFDSDFSNIKIHTDYNAKQLSENLDARAFTVGNDIYFNQGQYNPNSNQGKHLLAHELTHTLQQRSNFNLVQRSLKFEFQTLNYVWKVDNLKKNQSVLSFKPNVAPLPRKYSPSGRTEEDGNKPAYLSKGYRGGPKRAKGHTGFIPVKGEFTMKEAKNEDKSKNAHFIYIYKFKTKNTLKEILNKSVQGASITLISKEDKSNSAGFIPNTFEFIYLNAKGQKIYVHLNQNGKFKSGHIKHMKVGRKKRKNIKKKKKAQYEEFWKITEDNISGDVDLFGRKVRIELTNTIDNSKIEGMEGEYNPKTWEKNYFFMIGPSKSIEIFLDVHRSKDGSFKKNHIELMEKAPKLLEAKEQTAIELQSEAKGVLEFETPKWFNDWSSLKSRIQEAVDMTKAIDNSRQLKSSPANTVDAKILNDMKIKIGNKGNKGSLIGRGERTNKNKPLGDKVVEWPKSYSTSHLKSLGNRRLLIEIVDKNWFAAIQSSEGIKLSQYESLAKEHEEDKFIKDMNLLEIGNEVFEKAYSTLLTNKNKVNKNLLLDLRGFLQLIVTYIIKGQYWNMKNKYAKAAFRLMARSNFGSMYNQLLSPPEKNLFNLIVNDKNDLIFNSINKISDKLKAGPIVRNSNFFYNKTGTKTETFGPTIFNWLLNITKGVDKLTGPGISAAMGVKTVNTEIGDKDYKLAQFEVRGTKSHGGRSQRRDNWLSYAKKIFDAAAQRSSDTPDDLSTLDNESSKTRLKL